MTKQQIEESAQAYGADTVKIPSSVSSLEGDTVMAVNVEFVDYDEHGHIVYLKDGDVVGRQVPS